MAGTSNIIKEKQYNNNNCSGTPRSEHVWLTTESKYPFNYKDYNFVAFRGDEETNCRLDDTIDGLFYTDKCESDVNWVQWKVHEENGRFYLKKSLNTDNSCKQTPQTVFKYSYECNKCGSDGRLTKCYGIGKVKPFSDFTLRGPEDTLGEHSESSGEESHNQDGVELIKIVLVFMMVVMFI
ncbi:hypothetical protein EIN_480390 [Entamoeba invadens IP1]|uniref:Uncharacterized protein n=1 Tax=Entamoeba invadens IP1 TaxID=370355 RepID=L7FM90_ENTIV|nr:hypothetical protein EIN_480390 [Entamoeba invadens IP1]ELP91150.1 hypothetical protein EIN_480390 [Entamoeba invadens IP1]|eukprot:XP_004257921.1 hypothetical protein EIN_480390 [Entamoeba invadens IP1]